MKCIICKKEFTPCATRIPGTYQWRRICCSYECAQKNLELNVMKENIPAKTPVEPEIAEKKTSERSTKHVKNNSSKPE